MLTLFKVESALQLLRESQRVKFPHPDASEAVQHLIDHLETIKSDIVSEGDALSEITSHSAVDAIALTLMGLGLILNSANVRNALELHQPILALSRQVLGRKVNLILTYEWEYEPFTYSYQSYRLLKEFLFIGLPASEAQNALILPVTGHEIGHSLWRDEKALATKYELLATEKISTFLTQNTGHLKIIAPTAKIVSSNLFVETNGKEIRKAVVRQCEEVFCDLIAATLFGYSYLRVFEYFLSTPLVRERDIYYPDLKSRSRYLDHFSSSLGVAVPANYESRFPVERVDSKDRVFGSLVTIADEVREELFSTIVDDVKYYLVHRNFHPPAQGYVDNVVEAFKDHVPAENVGDIGAILNGAWQLLDAHSQSGAALFLPDAVEHQRIASLNELILKSVEILEIERKLRNVKKIRNRDSLKR
jgi:hypothetical protein